MSWWRPAKAIYTGSTLSEHQAQALKNILRASQDAKEREALRDSIAVEAMHALIPVRKLATPKDIATRAYAIADAMLIARAKRRITDDKQEDIGSYALRA